MFICKRDDLDLAIRYISFGKYLNRQKLRYLITVLIYDIGEVIMKKYLICIILVLLFVTGCQSSTEKNSSSVESEGKKNEKSPIATPKLSDSIQIIDYEYDIYKSGKEVRDDDTIIYFSNKSLLCYYKSENFFLYDRKTKQKHRIITIKNIDSCWGDMYEKDGCLYLALGVIINKKEKSYILKINERTFQGELIKIKDCNTIFSSVICSDNTLFIWFMKEQDDFNEYCLAYLKGRKINPVHSWIYRKNKNEIGQQMSTLGTNGDELFCYVEDKEENAHIEIYNGKGELAKNIPIEFSDFQNTSDGKDMFLKIYCINNTLLFETLDHRMLIAKYDGKNITRIKDNDLFIDNENCNLERGSCIGVASFSDKMILCGNLENTNQLINWEIDNDRIKNIIFEIDDAEILSYQMLTENEVILKIVNNNSESKKFYCKIE